MDLSLHPASSGVAARQRALAAAAAVWGVCLWCVKGGRAGGLDVAAVEVALAPARRHGMDATKRPVRCPSAQSAVLGSPAGSRTRSWLGAAICGRL